MSGSADGRLPLTIVTGFLGSGKTTLIRQLLTEPDFANAAIVVNELGEVGIDQHLFRQTEERITLLRDGCACCSRRDDLLAALTDLLRCHDRDEEPRFDRVILETTGLADPAPILHTIAADPLLSRRMRLDRVITTLDAVAGAGNLAAYMEAVQQVTAADAVVLTKTDLAPAAAEALPALVAAINPAAVVENAVHGKVSISALTTDGTFPPPAALPNQSPPRRLARLHTPGGVASLNLEFSEPLDWRMLGLWLTMLLHCHGERVLRVKGLLDVGSKGPLLLEGVQHVVHAPRHFSEWPPGDRRGQLVLIVRDLDLGQVRESLDAFLGLGAAPHPWSK